MSERAIVNRSAKKVLLVWAVYLVAALGTHASGLWRPMHADYSCWLRVARDWNAPASLYQETYDNKSPWVYRFVRAIDSPRPEVSCWLVESLLAAAAALLLREALTSAFPRTAGIIGLLLIAWTGTSNTFYGAQSTEAFAVWWLVAGLACWALAVERGRAAWASAAGAFVALAFLFRQPAIVLLAAWSPFLWFLKAHRSAATFRSCLAAGCAGIATVVAMFVVDCVASGTWDGFLAVTAENGNYGSLARVAWSTSATESAASVLRLLVASPVVVLFAAISLLANRGASQARVAVSRPHDEAFLLARTWRWTAGVWLLAALVSAWPGGRHFAHYYHLVWPGLAILAAMWLAAANIDRRMVKSIAAGCLLVALVEQAHQAGKQLVANRAADGHARQMAQATAFLAAQTTSETPVVVNVWGPWAELYWRAPRPAPGYRIPFALPEAQSRAWLEATLDSPPRWIVHDGTAWPPVDTGAESETAARMQTLLQYDYRIARRFGPLVIHERLESSMASLPADTAE